MTGSSACARGAWWMSAITPTIRNGPRPMVGYGARQHIRKNALQHLHQEATITRRQGSFTFEESLANLVKQGLVERQDALGRAIHVEELEKLLV